MRPFLCCLLLAACVGQPPQPCTTCGDVCVDTNTDVANCGGCDKRCAAGQVCTMGACRATCPATQMTCAGLCVDTQTDNRHCGGCGTVCAVGQVCSSGTCAASCAAPSSECSGACVNTQSDPRHCGACGNACDAGVCSSGTCRLTCLSPLVECPGAVCADLRGDPNHCGACGTVCTPSGTTGPTCHAGRCSYTACLPGFSDCDDDLSNGCEVQGSCVRSMLVSHTPDGGFPNGPSSSPVISADGTKVAFLSQATNLVPNDPGPNANVFLWDQKTNRITAIDVLPDGGLPTQPASSVSITPNGRYVCMNHNGPLSDVPVSGANGNAYLRDLDVGITRLASSYPDGGALPPGNEVFDCQVSQDGRFVAFTTRVVLDPRHNNGEHNVYLHDMQTGANILASVGTNGQVGANQGYGSNAFSPRLSPDATKVAWTSAAGYPTDNNSCFDTWYRDLDAGVTTKASISMACVQSAVTSGPVQIFGANRTLVMNSGFADAPGDNNSRVDIYFRDMAPLGAPQIRSDSQIYALSNADVVAFNATSDGGYLLMGTAATNLTNTAGIGGFILLKDIATYSVTQVNIPVAIGPGGGTRSGRLSDNGRFVTWDSLDTTMPGDTNMTFDVFWRQVR